jgi:hypothetical protein
MYGCCLNSPDIEDIKNNVVCKMIPILMSSKLPFFSFKDCLFKMEKSKETTARIVVYRELGINNSYTLEASFYGPSSGTCPDIEHFGKEHMAEAGKALL